MNTCGQYSPGKTENKERVFDLHFCDSKRTLKVIRREGQDLESKAEKKRGNKSQLEQGHRELSVVYLISETVLMYCIQRVIIMK